MDSGEATLPNHTVINGPMTTSGASSKPRSLLPGVILFLLLVGSLFAIFWQQQTVSGLRQENESLRAMTNELTRLRDDNEEVARLRNENQEIERLRKDNEDLYRLRNEVGQLRKEKQEWAKDRANQAQSRSPVAGQSQTATISPTAAPTNPSTTPTSPVADQTPKPWLGFYYVKVPPTLNADGSSAGEKIGTLVSSVRANSPAEKAGLQVNDHILKINGRTARTVEELDAALRSLSIGQSVTLDLLRQEFPMRIEMVVEDATQNK